MKFFNNAPEKEKVDIEFSKHIKELYKLETLTIVKDFSHVIPYNDYKEEFHTGDWEDSYADFSRVPEDAAASPFYRMKKSCIVSAGDKVSLVVYKAFAIVDEGITFIKDEASYTLKDMDRHIYSHGGVFGPWRGHYVRTHDVFLKDNALYGYTYSDGECHEMGNIKGELVSGSIGVAGDNIFYSIQDNVIYENKITNVSKDEYGIDHEYVNYISLESRTFHKDAKEVVDMKFVDFNYKNTDNILADAPDICFAAVITLADGTKRLIVKNSKGRKTASRYFNDIKLEHAYLCATPEEFEKEYPVEGEGSGVTEYDDDDCEYFLPGLTFDYTTDTEHGTFIVKKYGHMMATTRYKNK